MKGIILSGGSGTRLYPLTKVTSKQLLPVFDKPMIMYPLETLKQAGITEILVIVAPDHAGDFLKLLGSGREHGVNFTYEIQDKPEGLAQAFIIGENFIKRDSVAMILGDNIFADDFSKTINQFQTGAHIFAKKMSDPDRFGQVRFDEQMQVLEIREKPKIKISDYAITGLYLFDSQVVEVAKQVEPSARGELEITDIQNWYLQQGQLKADVVAGDWIDAGTFDTLYRANTLAYNQARGIK